ncbi:hypothetical protein ATANTOWER_009051 [Ataeniobius toweri]|uniref:Uncharacterized protein n=1 Tax=Ataeniobius toweri TaxID=208326 RepID=A0ABU7CFI2_9TELE|nr:hypothetical protein [Ataeniobius toweri]
MTASPSMYPSVRPTRARGVNLLEVRVLPIYIDPAPTSQFMGKWKLHHSSKLFQVGLHLSALEDMELDVVVFLESMLRSSAGFTSRETE